VALDLGAVVRLKAVIDATLAAQLGDPSVSVVAWTDAATTYREEVRRIAKSADAEQEFGRLFDEWTPTAIIPAGTGDWFAPQASGQTSEAVAHLAGLSGWLGGFVEEARLEEEARAYAANRSRQER
jgi:hypothetical protein